MITVTFASCKSDDEGNDQEDALIGVWQRSDASAAFEVQLTFDSDYTGMITSRSTDIINDTSTSSAVSIDWITFGDELSIVISENELITSPYTINSEGQLFISEYSELHFNRLE